MDEQIEIDLDLLRKAEKRVWVKPTSTRKGHYRKIKGAKAEVKEPKVGEKSYLFSKFENRFGKEIVDKYRIDLSTKDDSELKKDFMNLVSDDAFGKGVIQNWFSGVGMSHVDGWITKILGLPDESSKWGTKFRGEAKDIVDSKDLMEFYLLNQEILKRKFPDGKITLYRGLHGDIAKTLFENNTKGDIIPLEADNLSSWTEVPDVAEFFSVIPVWSDKYNYGVIIKATLPVEDMLMSTRLVKEYWDGNDPSEVIAIKPKLSVEIVSIKEYKDKINIREVHDDYYNKALEYWEGIK